MLVELCLVWCMLIMERFIFETKPHRNTGDSKIRVSLVFFFNLHSLLWSIEGGKKDVKLSYFNSFSFYPGLQWYPTSRRKGEDRLGQIRKCRFKWCGFIFSHLFL